MGKKRKEKLVQREREQLIRLVVYQFRLIDQMAQLFMGQDRDVETAYDEGQVPPPGPAPDVHSRIVPVNRDDETLRHYR